MHCPFAILLHLGLVAQSVEQRIENPCVGGSIPPQATSVYAPQRPDGFWGFSICGFICKYDYCVIFLVRYLLFDIS